MDNLIGELGKFWGASQVQRAQNQTSKPALALCQAIWGICFSLLPVAWILEEHELRTKDKACQLESHMRPLHESENPFI